MMVNVLSKDRSKLCTPMLANAVSHAQECVVVCAEACISHTCCTDLYEQLKE